jgi:hypothetical protein
VVVDERGEAVELEELDDVLVPDAFFSTKLPAPLLAC